MKPTLHHMNNQNGSAMVIALIIMALLTIIGHLATRSTRLEVQTATNVVQATDAYGPPTSFGENEVYVQVEILRYAS